MNTEGRPLAQAIAYLCQLNRNVVGDMQILASTRQYICMFMNRNLGLLGGRDASHGIKKKGGGGWTKV